MCSIAGIVSNLPERVHTRRLVAMQNTQRHRGPDGEQLTCVAANGVFAGLAHQRLSIMDPSPASAQPFRFGGHQLLVFNGEIYNYPEIREELIRKGYLFDTTGDVEVLAAAYAAYGPDCVSHFDGMFAFAIWDGAGHLFFARDRFGEKPLFFYQNDKEFLFASTTQALIAAGAPDTPRELAQYDYLTLGLVRDGSAPDSTYYKHIRQLPPAHRMYYDGKTGKIRQDRYWELRTEPALVVREQDATQQVYAHLQTAVNRRRRMSCSYGITLSGGVDSSILGTLLRRSEPAKKPISSFSAVFPGFRNDESASIRLMTDHLQFQPQWVQPSAGEVAGLLEEVIGHQGEPIGSSSVIAQYMVYREAARQGLKVVFDGQGADEVFAGYPKYTPWFLQEQIRTLGLSRSGKMADAFRRNHFLPEWGLLHNLSAFMPGLTARFLSQRARHRQQRNPWIHPDLAALAGERRATEKPVIRSLAAVQYEDLIRDGLQTLLRYADRNAMAHGLEVRLPYLSHELVEYVLLLPSALRMKDGYTKWILRRSFQDQLPDAILWQKGKIGFEPPQQNWMKNQGIREQLQESRHQLVQAGILQRSVLQKTVTDDGAHGKDSFDFRVLVAGILAKKRIH